MLKFLLVFLTVCSFGSAYEFDYDVENPPVENKIFKIIDRLTPEQQQECIDLAEGDELEKLTKEFRKIMKKSKKLRKSKSKHA